MRSDSGTGAPGWLPRGLSRVEAAAYVGVSPSLFGKMVADGRMPSPKQINARVVWDRIALDFAFAALPDAGTVEATPNTSDNPWLDRR